ncbi:OST-HTH/LOTUS domain-containing protein, partial [bacterium]|nr:OST-HTH/LOTUS domain-containing protein [bacterium]
RKPAAAKDAAAKEKETKDKDTGDKEDAFDFLCESIDALVREDKDIIWGSMVKQTMKRKRPEFNESYFGFASFSELLEEAAEKDIIHIKKDARSGTYVVTGFGENRL